MNQPAALLLASVLATAACDAGATGVPSPATRAERLARDRVDLRAYIRDVEATGLHPTTSEVVSGLLAREEGQWVEFPGWAIHRNELASFMTWGLPDPARDGRIQSRDFERALHPGSTIAGYAEAFAARGIDFFVVPVPRRLQIYPDRLPGMQEQESFAGVDLHYARFLLALADAGVEVVDLVPAFAAERFDRSGNTDERLFLDYDTHWTPRGAVLAADLIAKRVRELDWFLPGPDREGEAFTVERAKTAYEVRSTFAKDFGPVDLWFERVIDMQGENAHDRNVSDRDSEILVLGDSFPLYYQQHGSDLVSQLYARLGRRLDVISIPGQEADVKWKALARRGDGLAGKRLVIWVFALGALDITRLEPVELFEDGR